MSGTRGALAWLIATIFATPVGAQVFARADAGEPPLVLRGVTVVDVQNGGHRANQTIVVVGRTISTIGPAASVKPPRGARVVDAAGKYLIPGLWDLHLHPGRGVHGSYELLIAHGVTGFRDASSTLSLDSLDGWRRAILAGTRVGPPRQLLSGPPLHEEPNCGDMRAGCILAGDTAGARRMVDSLKAAGADILKTYSLTDAMYFFVVRAARRAGLRVGGHTAVQASVASDSGVQIIDHSTVNAELNRACFDAAATVAGCRRVTEHLARGNTWWVPTWAQGPHVTGDSAEALYGRFEAYLARFCADSAAGDGLADYLRGTTPRLRSQGTLLPSTSDIDQLVRWPSPSGAGVPDTAGRLYVSRNAGLPILAGTDGTGEGQTTAPPGLSVHVELASYAREGLTPLEALRTATLNPAKLLRATDSLGTVAQGKLADLVLLDGDPLADITNTAAIRAVVANGRYFDRAALDSLMADARTRSRAP